MKYEHLAEDDTWWKRYTKRLISGDVEIFIYNSSIHYSYEYSLNNCYKGIFRFANENF